MLREGSCSSCHSREQLSRLPSLGDGTLSPRSPAGHAVLLPGPVSGRLSGPSFWPVLPAVTLCQNRACLRLPSCSCLRSCLFQPSFTPAFGRLALKRGSVCGPACWPSFPGVADEVSLDLTQPLSELSPSVLLSASVPSLPSVVLRVLSPWCQRPGSARKPRRHLVAADSAG